MRAFFLNMVIAPIMLTGCTLEPLLDTAEPCSDIAYILVDGDGENAEKCMRDSCRKYSGFFDFNVCPADYPFCIEDEEGNYCASSCVGNTHFLSDEDLQEMSPGGDFIPEHRCEPNTVEHCGSHSLDCSNDTAHNPGWVRGYCDTSYHYPCVAQECKSSYRFDDYDDGVSPPRCVRYSECCGLLCSNCINYQNASSEPLYKHVICSSKNLDSAKCIQVCPSGFKVCNGLCIDGNDACEK